MKDIFDTVKNKKLYILLGFSIFLIFIESIVFILLLKRYKKLEQELYILLDSRRKYTDFMNEVELRIKKKILLA